MYDGVEQRLCVQCHHIYGLYDRWLCHFEAVDWEAHRTLAINNYTSCYGYWWIWFRYPRRLWNARYLKCLTIVWVFEHIFEFERNIYQRHPQLILGCCCLAIIFRKLHFIPIRNVSILSVPDYNSDYPVMDIYWLVPQDLYDLVRNLSTPCDLTKSLLVHAYFERT